MSRKKRPYNILAAGELLIDFISTDFADNMDETENFKRMQGGSPANLCMNMARLGNKAILAATIGTDAMGGFLLKNVQQSGLDTSAIRRIDSPTSLILVTRSKEVADFEAYRGADKEIKPEQLPTSLLKQVSIFHTTCFALSKNPAQSSIMAAAYTAAKQGAQLSIDLNYSPKIWPERQQAQKIVEDYCALQAIVKISDVDWERLYQAPLKDYKRAAEHFLKAGAHQVCVTLGAQGCYVADKNGGQFLAARSINVKDTTGAGDAFWSGYLTAWLDGCSTIDCAKAGRSMAEIKLSTFGPLTQKIPTERIYQDISQ